MAVSLKRYKDLLSQYVKPQWRRVLFLTMSMLTATGLQLVNPQILRYFIDSATKGKSVAMLTSAAALFMGIAILGQLVSIVTTYLSENLSWTATNALRADLTLHCLRLDMSFHKSHTPGEMIQRLDGDVGTLGGFFSQFLVGILSNFLLLIGVVVVLFHEDWHLGVSLGLFAMAVLVGLGLLRNFAVRYWLASFQAGAELFGFLEERLAGTEDVRACGATGYVMRRLYEVTRKLFRTSLKSSMAGNAVNFLNQFAGFLAIVMGLGLGVWLFQKGTITIGTVFLIVYYIETIQWPLQSLTGQLQYFQQSSACVERVDQLLQTKSKVQDGPGAQLPRGALDVEFEDVSFRYEEEHRVLKDISFRLEAGKVLGLLGRTGSGKRVHDMDGGVMRLCLPRIARTVAIGGKSPGFSPLTTAGNRR
jgi:ABC-type multidrug transport system fused ATPase/permease subunit